MADSIFTKIIKGEVPAHKIYEDEDTLAFMDIEPLTDGHVLVIPKKQVEELWDLDKELYAKVMDTTQKVALRIRQVLKPPKVGMNLEGFGVAHVHVHVFPLYKGMEATMEDYSAKTERQADDKSLTEMAKKLAF